MNLKKIEAGTPEPGGWTTREVKRIIRGLAGLNFVYVLLLQIFSGRAIEESSKGALISSRLHLPTIMASGLDIYLLRVFLTVLLADITGIAAADFVHDFLSMFLAKEPPEQSSINFF